MHAGFGRGRSETCWRKPVRRRAPTLQLGGEIAARSRQAFLPTAPDAFRGRVQLGDARSPGASYAVVSDGQRFVVLRATAALRAAHGKTVTITRDAKGRLLVRPDPDKDIGS